jgi:hypothetical protein
VRLLYWYLEGHTPVSTDDVDEWGQAFKTQDRRVAQTTVDQYSVSTVFLGIDHNWLESGPPVLFETMVFTKQDDPLDLWLVRYCTWDEAEAGHAAVVYKLQNRLEEPR